MNQNLVTTSFLKVIFWEYLQNLPVLAGFAWAYTFWEQGRFGLAVVCIFSGSATGAVLIALTENKIVAGHQEPVAVVIANIMGITVIMLGIVAYLSANWSGWLTDLFIGALAGAGLGAMQSLAAKEPIGWRHCLALAAASPWALMGVRGLMRLSLPAMVNILILTLLVTVVIGLIDYGPWRAQEK